VCLKPTRSGAIRRFEGWPRRRSPPAEFGLSLDLLLYLPTEPDHGLALHVEQFPVMAVGGEDLHRAALGGKPQRGYSVRDDMVDLKVGAMTKAISRLPQASALSGWIRTNQDRRRSRDQWRWGHDGSTSGRNLPPSTSTPLRISTAFHVGRICSSRCAIASCQVGHRPCSA
jgi:hypothetical protein